MTRTLDWNAASGDWAAAGNWTDVTATPTAAASPPGSSDLAVIAGPTIATSFVIAGPGSAAALTLSGGIALVDSLTPGTLTLGTLTLRTGTLDLLAGSTLAAGPVTLDTAGIDVNGGGLFTTGSTLTDTNFGTDMLTAANGGTLRVGGVSVQSALLAVDPAGVLEIGGAGGVALGTIGIDAGASFSGGGQMQGPVVDLGTIVATGALTFTGPVSGNGLIRIAPTGTVSFQGTVAAGPTVAFAAASGTLSLASAAPFGAMLTGLAPGNTIVVDTALTGAVFTPTGADTGTLALIDAGTTIQTVQLAGSYAGSSFLVLPTPNTGNTAVIEAIGAPGSTEAAPAGTGTGDTYVWNSATGGSWATVGNWTDQSQPSTTAAPGTRDTVTIDGPPSGAFQIVTGDGNAASLVLTGADALSGAFSAGTFDVGDPSTSASGQVAILAGATVAAGQVGIGGLAAVGGSGASLLAAGVLTLGDVVSGAGTLSVFDHGMVQAQSLVLAGFGPVLAVDGSSSVLIGNGTATAGAVTVAAGATAIGNGAIGDTTIIADGTIVATAALGGFTSPLTLVGTVTGGGVLGIGAGGALSVAGTILAGPTIAFQGSGAALDITGGGTGRLAAPITGLAVTDLIAIGDLAALDTAPDGAGGVLATLSNAAGTALATLDLVGGFIGDTLLVAPADFAGNELVLAAGTLAGSIPTAGTGTAGHEFSWNALGGTWGSAGNWIDATGSADPAAVAPGIDDSVTITDPAGASGAWQVVSGAGNAATLALGANVAFSGSFFFDTLDLETFGLFTRVGALDVVAGGTVQANHATLAATALVAGSGALLVVSDTLQMSSDTISGSSSLEVADHGAVFTGGLDFGTFSTTLSIDATGAVEVGNSGDAVLGALVVDAGLTTGGAQFGVFGNVVNHGTIAVADGGTGFIDGTLSGAGIVRLGNGAQMTVSGLVQATQTILLAGAQDMLILSDATLNGVIAGFAAGDGISIFGTTDAPITGADWAGGLLTLSSDGVNTGTLALAGDFTGDVFLTNAAEGGTTVTVAQLPPPCFAAGTRIATTRNAVAVEALRPGDRALNPWGAELEVVWLGHRSVDCRQHPRPWDVWPVRVHAGAFGPGVPSRDLLLSPDHAVLAGEVLIPVRYLINDATIVQEQVERVTYWHVELEQHDILLAEGLATESYLDTGNRHAFANGGAAVQLHADFASSVWDLRACARLALSGPAVAGTRALLLHRARELGHTLTTDADPVLRAGGRTIRPRRLRDGALRFTLPVCERVRLVSRSAVPAHVRVSAPDHRRLGVAVAGLALDGAAVALDDARLGRGWHDIETDCRWTDGDAELATGGARRLTLRTLDSLRYWVQRPEQSRRRG